MMICIEKWLETSYFVLENDVFKVRDAEVKRVDMVSQREDAFRILEEKKANCVDRSRSHSPRPDWPECAFHTKTDGFRTKADELRTKTDGLNTKTDGFHTKTDGFRTKTDEFHTKTDGLFKGGSQCEQDDISRYVTQNTRDCRALHPADP